MPRATRFAAACPPLLDDILARGLARDPAMRYPTAFALQTALDELVRTLGLAPSSREVAALMAEVFPGAQDLHSILVAGEDAAAAGGVTKGVTAPTAPAGERLMTAESFGPARTAAVAPWPAPASRRRRRLMIAVLCFAAAVVVFAGWLAARFDRPIFGPPAGAGADRLTLPTATVAPAAGGSSTVVSLPPTVEAEPRVPDAVALPPPERGKNRTNGALERAPGNHTESAPPVAVDKPTAPGNDRTYDHDAPALP